MVENSGSDTLQTNHVRRFRNLFFIALLISVAAAGIVTTMPVYADNGHGHGHSNTTTGSSGGNGNGNGNGNGQGSASATTTESVNTVAVIATNNLIATVNGMQLPGGLTASLNAKLNAAIDAMNRGQTTPATNTLNAFINKVNAQCCNSNGKPLTTQQANQLTAAAQQIIQSMQ